jgi:hypothetical protein
MLALRQSYHTTFVERVSRNSKVLSFFHLEEAAMKLRAIVVLASLLVALPRLAQSSYERPPKEILDVIDAPALPYFYVSPAGHTLFLGTPLEYRPISDFAEPRLRMGGVRNRRVQPHAAAVRIPEREADAVQGHRHVPQALAAAARESDQQAAADHPRRARRRPVPLQSEKLFEAVRGVGGTARLVILPIESHGYVARQSVEHTLYETVRWFDKYVKNAPPRAAAAAGGRP